MNRINPTIFYKHTVFLSQCGETLVPINKAISFGNDSSTNPSFRSCSYYRGGRDSYYNIYAFSYADNIYISSSRKFRRNLRRIQKNYCRSCSSCLTRHIITGSRALPDSQINVKMNIPILFTSTPTWKMLDL